MSLINFSNILNQFLSGLLTCIRYVFNIIWFTDRYQYFLQEINFGDLLFCFVEFKEFERAFDYVDIHLEKELKLVNKYQENYELLIPFTQIEQLLVRIEGNDQYGHLEKRATAVRKKVVHILSSYARFSKAASYSI